MTAADESAATNNGDADAVASSPAATSITLPPNRFELEVSLLDLKIIKAIISLFVSNLAF